ncbi:hypothetical protein PR048_015615 [Dryococelus australis]|uniref:RRM domain-containing protein n=1 Tax=Dryococelus australis TaxID=614101 RepID=A0ABQ9HHZ2_9NEOP|nr:hypothetical protein PR048_015615 [Dryococelus australis]
MESNIGERILNVMKQYNFDILQRNGQRISSVANWTEPIPPTDCEVFVGKIPKNCFEDELLPVMQKAGPVYEMRLMMDFSGQNRGYGFVKYTSPEYMERATVELNEYEIRLNQRLAVVKANNNCKLLLTGLPVNICINELSEVSNYLQYADHAVQINLLFRR